MVGLRVVNSVFRAHFRYLLRAIHLRSMKTQPQQRETSGKLQTINNCDALSQLAALFKISQLVTIHFREKKK